jgi:LPXTG-motif cell wall-anchored protein
VVTITETTTLSAEYEHCDVTAAVTQVNGAPTSVPLDAAGYNITLSQAHNTAQITNTVTCEQNLTLVKVVTFGEEPTSSWTLTATAPAPALAGPTGTHSSTTPVTAPVTAGVHYELMESGGPDTYVQLSWDCVLTEQPTVPVNADDGFVVVPRGQDVTCTVGNATATITLLKHVIDPMPGFEADAWTLTATPADLLGGALPTETLAGAEDDVAGASTFEVRPLHEYTLSEAATTATLAYRQVGLERWDGAAWVPLAEADIVAPGPGETAIYRFVNERIPAVMLPLTGGTSTEAYLISGGAVLLVAVISGIWAARRRRSMT